MILRYTEFDVAVTYCRSVLLSDRELVIHFGRQWCALVYRNDLSRLSTSHDRHVDVIEGEN